MNFDKAFDRLLKIEGGYSNHPMDPGGKTRFGITEKVARDHGYTGSMSELPVDLAKRIYLEDYWKPIRAYELPEVVRYAIFDGAVNSGASLSVKWVQRAVKVKDDGIMGPKTIGAVNNTNPDKLLRRVLSERLKFLTSLSGWAVFAKGWTLRVCSLMED